MTKANPATTSAPSDATNIDPAQPFWLLRAGTARKVGKQSSGAISYQIVADQARTILSIAIVGNATGGYFSREHVPMTKIESCLAHTEAGKPIASKAFKGAFVGRSANNSGFLAAVLRAEGLLIPAAEVETQHMHAGDWAAWQATALIEPGTLIDPGAGSDATPPPVEVEADHKKTLKLPGKKKP